MTIEDSAEFYLELPNSEATFALICYILHFFQILRFIKKKKKTTNFGPKHVTATDERVELNQCLLKLHKRNR